MLYYTKEIFWNHILNHMASTSNEWASMPQMTKHPKHTKMNLHEIPSVSMPKSNGKAHHTSKQLPSPNFPMKSNPMPRHFPQTFLYSDIPTSISLSSSKIPSFFGLLYQLNNLEKSVRSYVPSHQQCQKWRWWKAQGNYGDGDDHGEGDRGWWWVS